MWIRTEYPHPNPLGTECLDPREVREALGGFISLTTTNFWYSVVLVASFQTAKSILTVRAQVQQAGEQPG